MGQSLCQASNEPISFQKQQNFGFQSERRIKQKKDQQKGSSIEDKKYKSKTEIQKNKKKKKSTSFSSSFEQEWMDYCERSRATEINIYNEDVQNKQYYNNQMMQGQFFLNEPNNQSHYRNSLSPTKRFNGNKYKDNQSVLQKNRNNNDKNSLNNVYGNNRMTFHDQILHSNITTFQDTTNWLEQSNLGSSFLVCDENSIIIEGSNQQIWEKSTNIPDQDVQDKKQVKRNQAKKKSNLITIDEHTKANFQKFDELKKKFNQKQEKQNQNQLQGEN